MSVNSKSYEDNYVTGHRQYKNRGNRGNKIPHCAKGIDPIKPLRTELHHQLPLLQTWFNLTPSMDK